MHDKAGDLQAELGRAVHNDGLRLRYQPMVALDSGRIVGVEALVRWRHPERGLLPPAEFIPLAERSGQIVPIGHWVLREACRTAARWPDPAPGGSPYVSVNLSPVQILRPELARNVSAILSEADLDPSRLVLEITETVLLDDSPRHLETLNLVKELGVRLAVDDFGMGYASPNYLRRLPIDILKIAKPFVDALDGSREGSALMGDLLEHAGNVGLEVIAEGIERPDQRRILRERGCELGQGYLFSDPVDEEEIERMLVKGTQDPEQPEPREGSP